MGKQHERKKSAKLPGLLMFMGIFLLLAGISLGNSLVIKLNELNGEHSMDKVVVSAKNRPDSQGPNYLTLLNINALSEILKTEDIGINTNRVSGALLAANVDAAVQAEIVGTNYRYPEFCRIDLKYGSFFTHKVEIDGEAVAVIDKTLAWSLYKTLNAVGRKFETMGTVFKVVGVAEKKGSIIETLTDDGIPDVYIPSARLMELDTSAGITCLQIKIDKAGLPGQHEAEITSALHEIGKSSENYQITNYQTKEVLLSQIPLFVQFIPGIAAIFILIGIFLKNAKASFTFFKAELCDKDLRTVFSENLLHIGISIMKLFLLAAGICVIWLFISFKPYIPSEYIPDELINFAYYTNLIQSSIGSRVSGMGYVLPQVELISSMSGILAAIVTIIPALASFILIRSSFVRFKLSDAETFKLTLLFALMTVLSLVLTAGADVLLGLPVSIQVKTVLIVWTFIYIINFKIAERKDSEEVNV